MNKILKTIGQVPWIITFFLCVTVGLAPFSPPHVVEKMIMLTDNRLVKAIDWFDLIFHGMPWILLVLKLISAPTIKMIENRKD